MRLDQLELGATEVIEVEAEEDVPPNWTAGMEVTLRARANLLLVRAGTKSIVATAQGAAQAAVDRLIQQTLVIRLADVSGRTMRLQVHRFSGTQPLDFDIGVDEQTLVSASRIRPQIGRSMRKLLDWLRNQCLLEGDQVRAFLSRGHTKDLGEHFTLHGRSVRTRIKRTIRESDGAEICLVVKVTRGKGNADRHPLFVTNGQVRFLDKSEAQRLRVDSRAQLAEIRNDQSSFMALWNNYGAIEGEQILRRARRIGALAYTSFNRLEDGSASFFLKRGAEEALIELSEGDTLEAADTPPDVIIDPTLSWADLASPTDKDGRRLERVMADVIGRPKASERVVVLRPRDPDGFHPPTPGVLHLSLVGDAKRLERREKARELIWSHQARMPQLPLLLEGREAKGVALRSRAMPLSVERRIFPKHPPTQAQREAIQMALETPDLAIIQGPPGTGKTTVIRAVVESLNALAHSHTRAGQTLVTAFQHVAVENAIGQMSVNGLPPIKFGAGLEEVDQRIEKWRKERVRAIRGALPTLHNDEHRTQLRPLVDGYLLSPTLPKQTAELLTEVEGLVGHLVPARMMDDLRQIRTTLTAQVSEPVDAKEAQAIQALRALRVTLVSWSDDGVMNISRVLALARRGGLLTPNQLNELKSLAGVSEPSSAQLDALGQLRRQLLLKLLTGRTSRQQGATIRADVAKLLIGIREDVDAATRPQRQGPDDVVARFVVELETDALAVRRAILTYTPVYAATCQQAAGRDAATAKGSDLAYDDVVVDEAARANPLDLLVPLAQALSRIILVGDHKQLPHIVEDTILAELAEGVEDQDARDKLEQALKDSLFERLFTSLEHYKTPTRVVTLNDQFRMHPALGSFVSAQFYDNKLRSPRHANEFSHGLDMFGDAAAAWIDVPAADGLEEAGRSKSRAAEVKTLAELLPKLMNSPAGKKLSFGVITFYAKQVANLNRALAEHNLTEPDGHGGYQVADDYRWLEKPDGTGEPRLQVGTVDAFQGREFDVVFLSVVRCNNRTDRTPLQRRQKYGHLMSPNRTCVAMSRQKRLLVAVGDSGLLGEPQAASAIGPLVKFHELCQGRHGRVL